jgi:AcrR family transcriptional regulator
LALRAQTSRPRGRWSSRARLRDETIGHSEPFQRLVDLVNIIEHDGIDALTLRALGTAAGVGRGAPYRHFNDEDDLLAAIAVGGMRDLRDAMAAARHQPLDDEPLPRLEAMLHAYLEAALVKPAHYRLIYDMTVNRRKHPELKAEGATTYDLLLHAVREAQAAGALAPAAPSERLAGLLRSAAHGVLDLTLSSPDIAETGPGDPAVLIHLMLEQMRAKEPAKPSRRSTRPEPR